MVARPVTCSELAGLSVPGSKAMGAPGSPASLSPTCRALFPLPRKRSALFIFDTRGRRGRLSFKGRRDCSPAERHASDVCPEAASTSKKCAAVSRPLSERRVDATFIYFLDAQGHVGQYYYKRAVAIVSRGRRASHV